MQQSLSSYARCLLCAQSFTVDRRELGLPERKWSVSVRTGEQRTWSKDRAARGEDRVL